MSFCLPYNELIVNIYTIGLGTIYNLLIPLHTSVLYAQVWQYCDSSLSVLVTFYHSLFSNSLYLKLTTSQDAPGINS